MKTYQHGDIATFYFVIKEIDNSKIIQGWTDNKDIVKFYMDFHKCKKFKIKTVTKTIEDIIKIIEENWNDEITMYNIITKNRNKRKHEDDFITICIPATETECRFIREEANTFVASRINYGLINDAIPYLKNKYQDILQSIFLTDVVSKVIYSKNSKFTDNIQFDDLMILYKSFPENFGE